MKKHGYKILIEKDEDGVYVATVPELKGCHTQAKTLKELYPRIEEAIELYIKFEEKEVNKAITEAEVEYSANNRLLDAREALSELREKYFK
ncbi:type II toxin-antitoxin system HicB family antitoxin [Oxobacter pfennigii]|uniref:type II toxin-antitoxin system HicB family antitoxin n=1 Tax=Oxobacter pfennigii TaxID=36849 RepID=UPI00191C510D|nr:type II toxin-antitoxin system HicB family antitoxin [Oxobacter pfennigii]